MSGPVSHNVAQGTEAWRMLRAGIPTASQFHKIMTPKKRELSAQRHAYRFHLAGERLLGRYADSYASPAMQRGSALEADAVSFYELATDETAVPVGFITIMDGKIGASPDLLVGETGCGEIKCADSIGTHMAWLLGDSGIEEDYRTQVQGQLWVSGREWVDMIAYHPELPKTIRRTYRDEEFIADLSKAVLSFSAELEATVEKCRELGYFDAVKDAASHVPDPPQWTPMESLETLIARANASGVKTPV